MDNVTYIADHLKQKAVSLAEYPSLECPKCDALCPPVKVDSEGSVHHECAGVGHRKFAWRISSDGTMLQGKRGKREYRI